MVSPGDWQDGCVRRYVTGRRGERRTEERGQTQEEIRSEMELPWGRTSFVSSLGCEELLQVHTGSNRSQDDPPPQHLLGKRVVQVIDPVFQVIFQSKRRTNAPNNQYSISSFVKEKANQY